MIIFAIVILFLFGYTTDMSYMCYMLLISALIHSVSLTELRLLRYRLAYVSKCRTVVMTIDRVDSDDSIGQLAQEVESAYPFLVDNRVARLKNAVAVALAVAGLKRSKN